MHISSGPAGTWGDMTNNLRPLEQLYSFMIREMCIRRWLHIALRYSFLNFNSTPALELVKFSLLQPIGQTRWVFSSALSLTKIFNDCL